MREAKGLVLAASVAAAVAAAPAPAFALESPAAAGPIGGTDVRSGLLPPPGFFAGFAVLGAATTDFVGPNGKTIPAFGDAQIVKEEASAQKIAQRFAPRTPASLPTC